MHTLAHHRINRIQILQYIILRQIGRRHRRATIRMLLEMSSHTNDDQKEIAQFLVRKLNDYVE